MALTEAQRNAGWHEFACPSCGEPNGQMDAFDAWDTANGIGDRECEDCEAGHETFDFIMGLRGIAVNR